MTDVLARRATIDAAVEALLLFDGQLAAEAAPSTGVPTPARPAVRVERPDEQGSLHERAPGAGAMRAALALQSGVEPRSPIARLFGIDPLAPDAAPAYRRALRAARLARRLGRLAPEWTLLHAVPLGSDRATTDPSDLDHLLIGPAGVVAVIDAPDASRVLADGLTLLADGEPHPTIVRALEHAEDAAARLGVAVGHAVPLRSVVLTSAPVLARGRTAVPVLTVRELVRTLRGPIADPVADAELDALAAVAERPSTWRRRRTPMLDAQLLGDFRVLRREVRRAAVHRVVWCALGSAAVTAAAISLVATALVGG